MERFLPLQPIGGRKLGKVAVIENSMVMMMMMMVMMMMTSFKYIMPSLGTFRTPINKPKPQQYIDATGGWRCASWKAYKAAKQNIIYDIICNYMYIETSSATIDCTFNVQICQEIKGQFCFFFWCCFAPIACFWYFTHSKPEILAWTSGCAWWKQARDKKNLSQTGQMGRKTPHVWNHHFPLSVSRCHSFRKQPV